MKKLRKIYTVSLLLLCYSSFVLGQKPVLDSVCVQIENNIELNLSIYSYKNLSENVEKDLKSLQLILKDNDNIHKPESYAINYEPNKSMSIKPSVPGAKIIWDKSEQTRYQFNNQCNIRSESFYLQIKFNELDALISDSLIIKLIEVVDTTINIQNRLSTTYNYSFQGTNLVHNEQFDKVSGSVDAIGLKGGVGVSLIKSIPVIDLSAEIFIMLGKKGIPKNQFYTSYNSMADFEEDSKVNLNGFLNIGYRYNLSKTVEKPNWLGVEFGYLINRHGDLFGKNTFKLGVNWEVGKYISVSPQLYFSDDIVYPAVRIGFGF